MKLEKTGFSIIYLIFIISFIAFFGIIVQNKQKYMVGISSQTQIEYNLLKSLQSRSQSQIELYNQFGEEIKNKIIGYIPNTQDFYTLYWNHPEIMSFIDNNPKILTGSQYISQVSSGYVLVDIPAGFDISVLEVNKNTLQTQKNIHIVGKENFSSSEGKVGYLKNDNSVSSSTGNYKIFDFSQKNYIFQMKPISSFTGEYLRYDFQILSEISTGGVYFNPINDSGSLQYKGYDVIEEDGKYLYKILDY